MMISKLKIMPNNDALQRFLFEDHPVRGELVHLNNSYSAILERHPYPPPIQRLLGETLAAAALLSASLKYSGSLILEVHGKGQVNLLLAQANHQGHIRGLAKWEGEIVNETSFAELMAGGKIVITIDLGETGERYQGIVALNGEKLAEALASYFAQSEQLPTFIYLTADQHAAAGLLLQALPSDYDRDPGSAWEHLTHLSRTLIAEEIIGLPNEEILQQLFPEEDIRLFEEQGISFFCRCNRQRMEHAIVTMGPEEAKPIIQRDKILTVTCEFCNRHHDFDEVDVDKIFSTKSIH